MKRFLLATLFIVTGMLGAQQTHVHFPDNVEAPLNANEKIKFEQVYGSNATYVKERPSLLRNLKDLVRNRIEVELIPYEKAQGSKVLRNAKDLTTVDLYNVYNPNLTHDMQYSPQSFNILKYAINFYPEKRETYKLGNHYITILPQAKKERK